MLCKVKEDTIVNISGGQKITLAENIQYNCSSWDHQIYNNNFSGIAWSYSIFARCHTSLYNTNMTFKASMGSNSISENFAAPATAMQTFILSYSILKDTNNTENLTIKIYNSGSYSTDKFYISQLYVIQNWIKIPGTTGVVGKPRKLKSISQNAGITIFWVHTDNSRVTQDVE